jgi:ATP-dependent Lhr-like helicase
MLPVNLPASFHPAIRAWFERRFDAATEAQLRGWEAIGQGRDALVAAPTGSGKTLAAFLSSIDSLFRRGLAGDLPDGIDVVYVSPLKALSNDIQRNLEAPLAEIADYASSLGSMTGGQGSFGIELSHYEVVPGNIQQRVCEAAKAESEKED